MDALCRLEVVELMRRASGAALDLTSGEDFTRGFQTAVSYIMLQMGERSNLPIEIELFNGFNHPDPELVGQAMIMIARRNAAWDAYAKSFMILPDAAETKQLKREYDIVDSACVAFRHNNKAAWVFALGGMQPNDD